MKFLFKKKNKPSKTSQNQALSLGDYERAYVIGDVHGCLKPMLSLLVNIKTEILESGSPKTVIVFLGDLIDRGPESKQVLDFLIKYNPNYADIIYLMGNHEEVFLKVLDGHLSTLQSWFGFGGRSCVRSYGVDNLGEILSAPEHLLSRIQEAVPQSHIDFISQFEDYYVLGDYLCVHAGIRPKVALDKQESRDMRWIRERFLTYTKPHPYTVIHGHTIVKEAEIHSNRIAVDTGTYMGGLLTAARLDEAGVTFIHSDMRGVAVKTH